MALTFSNVLSFANGIGAIGLSVFNLRELYRRWTQLQEDPQASITEKACLVLQGSIQASNMAIGAVSLVSLGYEIKYLQDREKLKKIAEEARNFDKELDGEYQRLCARENIEHIDDPRVKELFGKYIDKWGRERYELAAKLDQANDQNLKIFQRLYGIIGSLQAVQLVEDVALHCYLSDIDKKYNLVKAILVQGSITYVSYSKFNCNKNLQINPKVEKACLVVNLTLNIIDMQRAVQDFLLELRHQRVILNQRLYLPYQLPYSAEHPSLNYLQLPEEYHEDAIFSNQTCPITFYPVTRALFIIQNGFPFLFEKQALVNYIFNKRESGQPLTNPYTNMPFRESDLYECPEWDMGCYNRWIQLQQQDYEKLKAQLQNQGITR